MKKRYDLDKDVLEIHFKGHFNVCGLLSMSSGVLEMAKNSGLLKVGDR
jgi:hypothetical protein